MTNIVLMFSHSYTPDKRIDKEAQTLIDHGLKVQLVCCGLRPNHIKAPTIYDKIYYNHKLSMLSILLLKVI